MEPRRGPWWSSLEFLAFACYYRNQHTANTAEPGRVAALGACQNKAPLP